MPSLRVSKVVQKVSQLKLRGAATDVLLKNITQPIFDEICQFTKTTISWNFKNDKK